MTTGVFRATRYSICSNSPDKSAVQHWQHVVASVDLALTVSGGELTKLTVVGPGCLTLQDINHCATNLTVGHGLLFKVQSDDVRFQLRFMSKTFRALLQFCQKHKIKTTFGIDSMLPLSSGSSITAPDGPIRVPSSNLHMEAPSTPLLCSSPHWIQQDLVPSSGNRHHVVANQVLTSQILHYACCLRSKTKSRHEWQHLYKTSSMEFSIKHIGHDIFVIVTSPLGVLHQVNARESTIKCHAETVLFSDSGTKFQLKLPKDVVFEFMDRMTSLRIGFDIV